MTKQIKETIESAIDGAEVHIYDPRQDGVHLEAVVIAEQFAGLSLIEQHQLVMDACKDLFESSLHALALKTYTPEKWKEMSLGDPEVN